MSAVSSNVNAQTNKQDAWLTSSFMYELQELVSNVEQKHGPFNVKIFAGMLKILSSFYIFSENCTLVTRQSWQDLWFFYAYKSNQVWKLQYVHAKTWNIKYGRYFLFRLYSVICIHYNATGKWVPLNLRFVDSFDGCFINVPH